MPNENEWDASAKINDKYFGVGNTKVYRKMLEFYSKISDMKLPQYAIQIYTDLAINLILKKVTSSEQLWLSMTSGKLRCGALEKKKVIIYRWFGWLCWFGD